MRQGHSLSYKSHQCLVSSLHFTLLRVLILALRVKLVRPCQLQRISCSICSVILESWLYGAYSHACVQHTFILALKVIPLDRLQGIICSVIQEP